MNLNKLEKDCIVDMKNVKTNNKVVFVNLAIDSGYNGVNHGIATLVPIARDFFYDVECFDIRHEISTDEFVAKIVNTVPSIVGFSTTSHQVQFLIRYSKTLKEESDVLQIAGGVGSTLDWEIVLGESSVVGCCIGEGEKPFTDLLALHAGQMKFEEVEGFYWKIEEQVVRNKIPNVIENLSTLAFPDYSIFTRDVVVQDGVLSLMLTRGCPFNCNYCCNKALGSIYPNRRGYFRLPPVDYCINLIKEIVRKYPETALIGFEDDLLIANYSWFLEFALRYKEEVGLPYRMAVRAESVSGEIVKAMKESGCVEASLGLESGNETVRRKTLNRKYTNAMLLEKCRLIKESGIPLFTFNIVGFPMETIEQMEETFAVNKRVGPGSGVCTFFHPYRNTTLYEICEKNGLLKTEDGSITNTNYNTRPGIRMNPELEKTCIAIKLKMTKYFARQRYLTKMATLPDGLEKYLLTGFYWFRYQAEVHSGIKKIAPVGTIKNVVKKIVKGKALR